MSGKTLHFHGIPTVHYSETLMEPLSKNSNKRWHIALRMFERLRKAGIRVFVVPQVQDKLFYGEYPYKYVQKFCDKAFLKHPYILFVIGVRSNDNGEYRISSNTIMADHNIKVKADIQVVLDTFKRYSWFSWGGSLAQRMTIVL